jgi:hypothetical protein
VTVTVSATGGTATSGTDYTGLTAPATFADGQTTASAAVTIVDDSTVEGDAYDPMFFGGVSMAAVATSSGGTAAILTGSGSGTAGQVKVCGVTGALSRSFYPFGSDFFGGVRVGAD